MNKYIVLKQYFGYENFRGIQRQAIDSILAGKDTVALLATGGGKSLIFQIPALLFEGITIVITPLISLMVDQVESLKNRKIKAEYISSSMDEYELNSVYNKIKRGIVKIIYISAERLENQHFLEVIKDIEISLLCLDESHSIEERYAFRPAYGWIPHFIATRVKRPIVAAVTATATKEMLHSIIEGCTMIKPNIFKSSFDRPNLYYAIYSIRNKNLWLEQYITKNMNKGIIYCLTRRRVETLYSWLKNKGYDVLYYHGGMDSKEKMENQIKYTKTNNTIMIATISFGLGIDLPNIRYTILYDLPSSIENLVQMFGRCSRDGEYGEGILLYQQKDIETNLYFIHSLRKTVSDRQIVLNEMDYRSEKLRKVVSLCTTKKCIHQQIMTYFSQKSPATCNNCSNCLKNKKNN